MNDMAKEGNTEDKVIYMEVEDEDGPTTFTRTPPGRKGSKWLLAFLIASVLITAGIGIYLRERTSEERDVNGPVFRFAINARWDTDKHSYTITFPEPTEREEAEFFMSNGSAGAVRLTNVQPIGDRRFLVTSSALLRANETVNISVIKNDRNAGFRRFTPRLLQWERALSASPYDFDSYHLRKRTSFQGNESTATEVWGELTVREAGRELVANVTGSGRETIVQNVDDPESGLRLEQSLTIDLEEYFQSTISSTKGERIIAQDKRGSGTGTGDYEASTGDGGSREFTADIAIEEYEQHIREHNITSSRLKGEGTLSGDVTGTILIEEDTVGVDTHKNYEGVNFSCIVREGNTRIKAKQGPTPVYITNYHKVWHVRDLDFRNRDIYYESKTIVSGQTTQEGADYVDNAPEVAGPSINEVTRVKGFAPTAISANDTFVLSTSHGYKIKYSALAPPTSPGASPARGHSSSAIYLEGTVEMGGWGDDALLLGRSGDGSLLLTERHLSLGWRDQYLSANLTLQ